MFYQWTDDGIVEKCTIQEKTLKKTTICYHCGTPITDKKAIKVIVKDDIYLLHQSCANRNCFE